MTTSVDDEDLPEQIRIRRAKRDTLIDRGMDPYPVSLPITHSVADVREKFEGLATDAHSGEWVAVAGRVIFARNTGKLCFATLRAGDGSEIQAMLSLDKVGASSLDDWKALVDLGDQVLVRGQVISSRRGELSVLADEWMMASKALRPLPVAHKPLSEEARVRQRYVDLLVRPEAARTARLRVQVVAGLRSALTDRGFLEVETPMLQTQHGGAAARPFVTHSNALDLDLYLRIAPELFLKRAVVGGLDKVFEINRNFRNEGIDSSHSPEFAMLEFYQAFADYRIMADLTRDLILETCRAALGGEVATRADGSTLDLSGQWSEIDLYRSLSEQVGEEITPESDRLMLQRLCDRAGIVVQNTWVPGKLVEELFEYFVVPILDRPTFVFDFPEDTSPLVRAHRSRTGVVEKWDLYIGGVEQATGYSELVDPVVQRQRLTEQAALADRGDDEAMRVDEDFLRALEHGMPPTGGVGLGVDRLLMNLTGYGIRETILFPIVKPER